MTSGLPVDVKHLGRTDLHPVALDERVDLVDVVRGFALYGVLLANLVWITTDVVLTDARLAQLPTAPLDRVVKPLVVLFIDHKFYTLFSFLFGLGFAIQLERAEARGRDIVTIYARRVGLLGLIGALHIAFLWFGDILLIYAIGGLGLLFVRRWNLRAVLILAIALALFARTAVGMYPLLAGHPPVEPVNAGAQADAEKERMLAVFDGGSYGDIAAEDRSFAYASIVSRGIGLFLIPQVFARFLFGLYVGRRGWAHRTADLLPALRRLLPWAIASGIAGHATHFLIVWLKRTEQVGSNSYWLPAVAVIEEAGMLAFSIAYLILIVIAFHGSSAGRRRLGHLAPVGRMALTNYLAHSLLYLLLFTGVGFGWYGDVGPFHCVVLSIAIFGAQIVFSRWWLSRYRFGPAEWLWRTLTYGRLQPMHAPRASPSEA